MHSQQPISSYVSKSTVVSATVRWLKRISILFLLCGAILIGLLQIRAPQPVGSDAPLEAFSAERAMEKLNVIANEPHPSGSPANYRVRNYLMAELEALGLNPEVQHAEGKSSWNLSQNVKLGNIVVRIPGTDNSKALMIAAHYDSVPNSAGAADDGAAIAGMLETVRALQTSEPLKNDLILLMTDGEEMGLMGAEAFIREHPWAKEVGLVLNFEARGNRGPSFMFETSEQNGWLIEEFMKAAPQPIAYSLVYNVYKLMPNDTDLTVFREGGLSGLNFAFGMGLNAYHQMIDTPENLDRSSLQHHGEYMLSLTRHFGQLDLTDVKQGDRVYFNVFGWKMVSYPESWAIGFMLLGVLMFVFTVWHGLYHSRISLKGMIGSFLAMLLSLVVVFLFVTLIWSILKASVSNSYYLSIMENLEVGIYYFIGMLIVIILLVFLLIRMLSSYVRTENLWLGTLLLWVLLSALTTLYLPGGSYLFTWPLLFSLIGLNLCYRMREGVSAWMSVLFALPGILLFTPILYLVFVMLTLDMAAVLLTVAALTSTLIYPLFCRMARA